MSTQHTPGPWKQGDGQHSYRVFAVGNGNGEVARCHGRTHTEAEFNARLIAAAPELIELLSEIVQEWERQKGLFPELKKDGWMDMRIARATNIIARVTTNPDHEYTGEPDPTDLARDYNEGLADANQPTEYDP